MYKKDGIIYFDCDGNKENYSQRNNQFVWKKNFAEVKNSTMCNVTSYVMFADYAGWKLPVGKYTQPEDNFADFIMNSKEVDDYYKKNYPAMYDEYKAGKKGCYTPNEIHSILSYAFNLWVKVPNATRFIERANFPALCWKNFVLDSLPFVISGSFPKSNGVRLNHIVVCTGFAMEEKDYIEASNSVKLNGVIPNDIKIAKVKIDDPYGNTLNDWQGSGNDIFLPWSYVVKNIKPLNSSNIKWAHVIERPVAVV